jgi:hypothetical protein
MSIYQENGFNSRKEYLLSLAEEFALDDETVLMMAHMLGPDEDFDGLVTILADEAERLHNYGWNVR